MSFDTNAPTAFEAFDQYDFASDKKFCTGWENIRKTLRDEDSQDLIASKLLEAKIFYFSKFFHPITVSDFKVWSSTKKVPAASENDANHPNNKENQLSFGEVIEIIEKGGTLPGVQDLNIKPTNTRLTQSRANRVKKPWEA